MTTIDLPPETPPSQALTKIEPQNGTALPPQQESFDGLMKLAAQLVTTGFLPVAVKTPAQAVAIILTGKELGLGPMQSLRSICIIQGKPELAADLQLSIFHRDGGRSKWVELTDLEAVLWLRHPNGDEHTETFTMNDAKRAGLTGANWQKYPKPMLRSRAITAGLKSIGFEPQAGAYAPGEIGGPEIVEGAEENNSGASGAPGATRNTSAQNATQRTVAGRTASTGKSGEGENAKPPTGTAKPAKQIAYATKESRMRFLNTLGAAPGQSGEEMMRLFCIAAGGILDTEGVTDLPLCRVPVTKGQVELWKAALADFESGEDAAFPFHNEEGPEDSGAGSDKPERKPERPTQKAARGSTEPEPAAAPSDDEWFMRVVCPVPRKGMKRDQYLTNPDTIGSMYEARHDDEYLRKRLFGLMNNFVPEGWTKRDGTKMPPNKADIEFREALDAFADWAEKKGERI